MNVVVDTNVLISAVLWFGPSYNVLKTILDKYCLVQCSETLKEFENVIKRKKISKILKKNNIHADTIIETLIKQSSFYYISDKNEPLMENITIEDANDLKFVKLAIQTNSKFIVSGDKHLLKLKKVGNIKILNVNDFHKLHKPNP